MKKLNRKDLVSAAYSIAATYAHAGRGLTLRGLYYRLVATGQIPNSQNEYKRLGAALTDARYDGTFPVNWLEDGGRTVGRTRWWAQPYADRAIEEAKSEINGMHRRLVFSGRWCEQPQLVYVWVEKQALANVFAPVCNRLQVGLFACKGYPSVSALAQFRDQLAEAVQPWVEEVHVLYFGDHDPDGFQIPRSAEDSLWKLGIHKALDGRVLEFHRVALNMEQINEFNPPPFPAKRTSSRFQRYYSEHGVQDAWELDALEPEVLENLIRANVENRWNRAIWDDLSQTVREERDRFKAQLKDLMDSGDLF